jgi:hypothetical protein
VSATFGQSADSQTVRILQNFREAGQLPAALFCLLVFLARHGGVRMNRIGAVVSTAAALLVAQAGLNAATVADHARMKEYAAVSSWRAKIPEGTEVLWFEDPLSCWSLLERPSHVSNQQAASALFSRAAAMETRRRLRALESYLRHVTVAWRESESPMAGQSVTLTAICAASGVRFIVTNDDLGSAGQTLPHPPPRLRGLRLYTCPS